PVGQRTGAGERPSGEQQPERVGAEAADRSGPAALRRDPLRERLDAVVGSELPAHVAERLEVVDVHHHEAARLRGSSRHLHRERELTLERHPRVDARLEIQLDDPCAHGALAPDAARRLAAARTNPSYCRSAASPTICTWWLLSQAVTGAATSGMA